MSDGSGSALAVVETIPSSLDANVGVLMRRATDVAGVCKEIVLKTAMELQGKKYVRVEGWQSIAVAFGCVASSRDVERVPGGFRSIGEVRRMSDGQVIATAEGFVSEDEPVWFGGGLNKKTGKPYERRSESAIRNMAQTRSISRACRSAFAFIVTLIDGKLSTTPAEEADLIDDSRGSIDPPAPVTKAPVSRGTTPLREAMRPSPPKPSEPPPHEDADFRADEPQDVIRATKLPTTPPSHDRNMSFRFGRDQGVTVADLSEASLKWYANCFARDLADESKANFHAKTKTQLDTVNAELAYRGL